MFSNHCIHRALSLSLCVLMTSALLGKNALAAQTEKPVSPAAAPAVSGTEKKEVRKLEAEVFTDEECTQLLEEVSITLEGSLPEKGSVRAWPVEQEMEDQTPLAAFEVAIYDSKGVEWKPEAGELITVTVSTPEIAQAMEQEQTLHAWQKLSQKPEQLAKLDQLDELHKQEQQDAQDKLFELSEVEELVLNGEERSVSFQTDFFSETVSDTDPNKSERLEP